MEVMGFVIKVIKRWWGVKEEEGFPVNWNGILAYRPYYRAFAAFTEAHLRGTGSGRKSFAELVGEMEVYERRNFVMFLIYQLSRERGDRDPRFYGTTMRMLEQVFAFELWSDEHEMIYLGRAFMAFVPFDHPHIAYWPLGLYLDKVAAFRRKRRRQRAVMVHSFLGKEQDLFTDLLDRLAPEELIGYSNEIGDWRTLIERMLANPTGAAAQRRVA